MPDGEQGQINEAGPLTTPFITEQTDVEQFAQDFPARAQALAYLETYGDTITDVERNRIERWFAMMDRVNEYALLHREGEFDILYPNQLTVFDDLIRFLEDHSFESPRGYIRLPTGSGKTVLFGEFVKATRLRTLIVVPTKKLLHQTKEKMTQIGESEGLDIGKVYGDAKQSDSHVVVSTYLQY